MADPLADNTDTYAFRSTEPGRGGFVTLIANWIPFQEPSGGPHFYKFDDTVLYEIYIDNTGDGAEDVTYQFRFKTRFKNGDSILGMAAPNQALNGTGGIEPLITSLDDPDYNEPQTYSVTRIASRGKPVLSRKICSRRQTTSANEQLRTTKQLSATGSLFTAERRQGLRRSAR